jgi:TatD DNase family protein
LFETDAPFLAPVPHRGKRNEPAWVTRVAEAIAKQRGIAPGIAGARAFDNFVQLFRP